MEAAEPRGLQALHNVPEKLAALRQHADLPQGGDSGGATPSEVELVLQRALTLGGRMADGRGGAG